MHNFTDIRAKIDVTVGSQLFINNTLPSFDVNFADFKTGQTMLYNETNKREFHVVLTGKNRTEANRQVKF